MNGDGIDPDVYLPQSEFPPRFDPIWVDCPGDVVPAAADPWEREGLWIVVYHDTGGVAVVDAPEPARNPIQ